MRKVGTLNNGKIVDTDKIKIWKDEGLLFEIGTEITKDIAEAVVLMDSFVESDDIIWDIEISDDDRYQISPQWVLYWLTGGDSFWINNRVKWYECVAIFHDSFSDTIIDGVSKARTLGEVRESIYHSINLMELWDFVLINEFDI